MSVYSTSANFQAVDGISSVVQGIAGAVASMAQDVIGNISGITEGFGAAADAALGLAEVGIGALVGAAVIGVTQMEAMNKSMAGVEARTAAGAGTMKVLRKNAEDLFDTGLVANFDDAARAVESFHEHIKGLQEDSPKAQQLIDAAAGVGKAWGESGANVIEVVGRMQKLFSDFSGDPMQALDMLTAMAQKTGKPFQDIESIVERLGPKFTSAGLSAMGMAGLITQAADIGMNEKGMAGLSKAIDTFHDKVMHPDSKFIEGLKILGLGTVADDLKTNKITMTTALDEIFTALNNKAVTPAQAAAAAMDLFGKNIDQSVGVDKLKELAGFADALGGEKGIKGAADTAAKAIADDGTLGTALNRLIDKLKTGLGDAAQQGYDRIKGIDWNQIGVDIVAIDNFITPRWNALWAALPHVVTDTWGRVVAGVLGAVASVQGAFSKIAGAISSALAPAILTINELIAAMNAVLGTNIPSVGSVTGGGGGGGGDSAGATGIPKYAMGGNLNKGWNVVGDPVQPELVWSDSGGEPVIPNNRMPSSGSSGSGSGSGGNNSGGGPSTIEITLDGTVLARVLYPYTQAEDQRRGKRQ